MTIVVNSIKYSIFGNYNFLEATPDNISKLYGIFGKEQFLPNMLQTFQIDQIKNSVTRTLRPQFINEDRKCSISFLNERIDIEMQGEEAELDKVIQYYEKIINSFQIGINRVALNVSAVLSVTNQEEANSLRKNIISDEAYPYNDNLIEWGTRNVARKKCTKLDEMANIGQNLQSIGIVNCDGIVIRQIKIDTDINTLGEKNAERFNVLNCREFFEEALIWNQEMLDNLERMA